MPPKKRPGKDFSVEGSSQDRGLALEIAQTTTDICRAFSNNGRNQKTQRATGTTGRPGGGAPHEHLCAKHSATTSTSRDQNSRGSTIRFRRGDRSNHQRFTDMPPLGEWALVTHAGIASQKKGNGEKSPDHATTNQTRKSNSGRTVASNRTPPSAGTQVLGARALVTATSAIVTSSVKYISPDKTKQHRQ
jgi:hypothetical protein